MRVPTYLSYSSQNLFESDADEFVLKYLTDNRPARLPQTEPMCVGSAFDAYVKSLLHEELFGKGVDPVYELTALFEDQVEPHNRDFAWGAGEYCLAQYKRTGSYDELLKLLKQSVEDPRFECKLTGVVGGAPFLGKPDCRFVLDRGEGRISVILDWKVKSFCSKYAASPTKGYMLCRDAYDPIPNKAGNLKSSASHMKSHKMYMKYDFRGMTINRDYMENCSESYASQCTLYGWLLGDTVGSEETVVCIDELVAKPTGIALKGEYPLIRVANHMCRVKSSFQFELEARVKACWEAVTSGHIFTDLSREESDERVAVLNDIATGLASDGSMEENWYSETTRTPFFKG